MDAEASIRQHLQALYGSEAEAVYRSIHELIGHTPAPSSTSAVGLTQKDAILITYGGQVREPPAPPLRTLARVWVRG